MIISPFIGLPCIVNSHRIKSVFYAPATSAVIFISNHLPMALAALLQSYHSFLQPIASQSVRLLTVHHRKTNE